MKLKTYAWVHLVAGLVAGCILSVTPFIFLLVALLLLLGLWCLSLTKAGTRPRRLTHIVSIVMTIAIGQIACWLPIKPLDKIIPPVNYPPMTVSALVETIQSDHGLRLDVRSITDTNLVIAFHTDNAMSLRAMLDKFANDTGHEWDFLYCPNGSTFLWGTHPDVIVFVKKQ